MNDTTTTSAVPPPAAVAAIPKEGAPAAAPSADLVVDLRRKVARGEISLKEAGKQITEAFRGKKSISRRTDHWVTAFAYMASTSFDSSTNRGSQAWMQRSSKARLQTLIPKTTTPKQMVSFITVIADPTRREQLLKGVPAGERKLFNEGPKGEFAQKTLAAVAAYIVATEAAPAAKACYAADVYKGLPVKALWASFLKYLGPNLPSEYKLAFMPASTLTADGRQEQARLYQSLRSLPAEQLVSPQQKSEPPIEGPVQPPTTPQTILGVSVAEEYAIPAEQSAVAPVAPAVSGEAVAPAATVEASTQPADVNAAQQGAAVEAQQPAGTPEQQQQSQQQQAQQPEQQQQAPGEGSTAEAVSAEVSAAQADAAAVKPPAAEEFTAPEQAAPVVTEVTAKAA